MQCDVSVLAQLCISDELDWDQWDYRQKSYSAFVQTKTVPFLFLENGIHPSHKQYIEQYSQSNALEAAVEQVIAPLLSHYSGYAVKLVLTKLLAGGVIRRHADYCVTLESVHRCHLPIITAPEVEFEVDGITHYFPAGTWREIDNQRLHEVRNKSNIDRVHLMCDVYVP